MKIKSIEYSRVFSLGNYENKKVGIIVDIEKDEDPEEAYNKAFEFVESQSPQVMRIIEEDKNKEAYNEATKVLANPEAYDYSTVKKSSEIVLQKLYTELPF